MPHLDCIVCNKHISFLGLDDYTMKILDNEQFVGGMSKRPKLQLQKNKQFCFVLARCTYDVHHAHGAHMSVTNFVLVISLVRVNCF